MKRLSEPSSPRVSRRRRWMASAASRTVGVPILVAACLGISGGAAAAGRPTPSSSRHTAARVATAACSTAVASARRLAVPSAFVSLTGSPFGISVTSDGRWSFVDETSTGRLAALSTRAFRPRVVRTIAIAPGVQGNSLTPDGRYLLLADGVNGAIVVSVTRSETGAGRAVLGSLAQPGAHGLGGAIEVVSSPDGRYAFISVEYETRIAVYNLHAALADHFSRSSYIGSIPVGQLVDGLAISPDGRWLYATSEIGTLSVIRLASAERQPSRSVVSTVPAGCNPTRVVPSPDGRTVWVAARGSNQLLAFSSAKLRTDPAHAQLTAVGVGAAPVGLALINNGREVVIADSDRFQTPGAVAELTVVSIAAALGEFGQIISSELRAVDMIGRWGGEEFLVLLRDTSGPGALDAAERLRIHVCEHVFTASGVRVTCSIGVAVRPQHVMTRDELVAAADQAMYQAKHRGRNTIVVAVCESVPAQTETSTRSATQQ